MRLLHPTPPTVPGGAGAAAVGSGLTATAAAAATVCFAYIEFYSIDHATYVLQCTTTVQWESQLPHLRIAYARETAMRQLFQAAAAAAAAAAATAATVAPPASAAGLPPPPVPPSVAVLPAQQQLVAQALQAAQWNLNNGYAASPAVPPTTTATHPEPLLPSGGPTGVGAGVSGADASVPTVVPPAAPVAPVVWPPQFETNGGLYVFQAKTGCFLEPRSDFTYDPRAKVYLRRSDAACFRFDKTLDPPFRPCAPPPGVTPGAVPSAGTTSTTDATPATVTATTAAAAAAPVKLSIALNKKPASAATGTAVAPKRAQRDIAKWGAIQREMHDDDDEDHVDDGRAATAPASTTAATASSASASATTTSATSTAASVIAPAAPAVAPAVAPAAVAPTAASASTAAVPSSGSAATSYACLLCQRGFSSAEMLARHEKESKLHAENLAKQQQKQQAQAQAQQPQYRDRAEERRLLFGSDADHIPRVTNPVDVDVQNANEATALPVASTMVLATSTTASAASSSSSGAAPVDVAADAHNPGNLLLRKFGWTDGQGLGKDNSGRAVAVGVELASAEYAQKTSAMQATLRSTLGTSVPAAGAAGGATTLSRTQQNMAAARARFDELEQHTEKRT